MYYVLRRFKGFAITLGGMFMGAKRVFVDRQAGQVVRIELGPDVNPKMSVEHLFSQSVLEIFVMRVTEGETKLMVTVPEYLQVTPV